MTQCVSNSCSEPLDVGDRRIGAGCLCWDCYKQHDGADITALLAHGMCRCSLCDEVVRDSSLARHRTSKICAYRAAVWRSERADMVGVSRHFACAASKLSVAVVEIPPHPWDRDSGDKYCVPEWAGLVADTNLALTTGCQPTFSYVRSHALTFAACNVDFQRALVAASRLGGEKAVRALLVGAFAQRASDDRSCDARGSTRAKGERWARKRIHVWGSTCQAIKPETLL